MVWELGIQTDTDSHRRHCSSNILRHLPTAPQSTPGPCQRGIREEPWVSSFWGLAEDTASAQKEGGPQKELVSQGEAGTPAPPESADPVPRNLTSPLPATPRKGGRISPPNPQLPALPHPRLSPSIQGKFACDPPSCFDRGQSGSGPFHPPQAGGWPGLGSGSALCSRVG